MKQVQVNQNINSHMEWVGDDAVEETGFSLVPESQQQFLVQYLTMGGADTTPKVWHVNGFTCTCNVTFQHLHG